MPQTNSTDRRQIASLVSRLLSHYWTADDRVETREAQIEDWIEDLREFGHEIVAEACSEWRRSPGGRRPTPGDIRALCLRDRVERTPLLTHGAEDPDAWARSLGWASFRERQDAIVRNEQCHAAGLTWQSENATALKRAADILERDEINRRSARVAGFKSVGEAQPETSLRDKNDRG